MNFSFSNFGDPRRTGIIVAIVVAVFTVLLLLQDAYFISHLH
jgi:hypothetical protein